ncbi:uncharacterized protein [Montipora foliosa]|uniref:uncharacterized protein n=1 Tax=Montipora foliosa TaxID=591990 RepID=UPI0035F16908
MPVEGSKLDNLLTKFWEISKIPEESDKNDDIIINFQKTTRFKKATGRYNIRLPWKLNKCDLPTNFILSKRRLNSLLNSLNKKDPGLIKKYYKQLLEQVNLGFIEKVGNLNLHDGILHYIPHFPVFKTDSVTTKMGIVYDASARLPEVKQLHSRVRNYSTTPIKLTKNLGIRSGYEMFVYTSNKNLFERHRSRREQRSYMPSLTWATHACSRLTC